MKNIPDASIDCVLTDPPYGTTACKWDSVIPFEPMWTELRRIAKPKAAICLFGSQPFTSALVMSNPKMFRYEWIWEKSRAANFANARYNPLKKHENVSIFSVMPTNYFPEMAKGAAYNTRTNTQRKPSGVYGLSELHSLPIKERRFDRNPTTVLSFASMRQQDADHPTQKPAQLLRYLIRTYTQENETVLDFTMGSGSTGVACQLENRNFIGIEKDAEYFAIAKKRIEGVTAKEPLFI